MGEKNHQAKGQRKTTEAERKLLALSHSHLSASFFPSFIPVPQR